MLLNSTSFCFVFQVNTYDFKKLCIESHSYFNVCETCYLRRNYLGCMFIAITQDIEIEIGQHLVDINICTYIFYSYLESCHFSYVT